MNKEFEKEIINCSRCGLCMEVCPVYSAKKTETSLLRGKFLQILGLIRKELKYDKNLAYNLDLCLGCNKCKKACPSDINALKIFAIVRSENQNIFEKIFYSAPFFKLKLFSLKMMYKLKYPIGRRYYKKREKFETNKKIAHFNGCATKAIGLKFDIPQKFVEEKFSCCALPFYIKGRFDLYEKYKKRNIELIKKYDKVVFDCATCYDTVLNYDGVEKEKLVYFTDFYKNQKLKVEKQIKVAFHKPCHLDEKTLNDIEIILKNTENVIYVDYQEKNDCCGFGGDFFTRHVKSATTLSLRKIDSLIKNDVDVVLTSCPTCLWSLKFGIKYRKSKIKAYDIADFLHNFTSLNNGE